jgi:hypothetical protein
MASPRASPTVSPYFARRYAEYVREPREPRESIVWSTYGYEILGALRVREYSLENFNLVLRHNEQNIFLEKLGPRSNVKDVLKKLEVMGKESCNSHISGFCCVAERARLMPPHSSVAEFYKVGVTVKAFVEANLHRLLKDLALHILHYCDDVENSHGVVDLTDDVTDDITDNASGATYVTGYENSTENYTENSTENDDVVMEAIDVAPPVKAPERPREWPSECGEGGRDGGWMLVVHSVPGKYMDLDHDWMKFLRMCLDVANTLGVSNRENMYQNCLKAMMTTRHISHMSPYQCVVKLPTGDMVKVGECDIMVEFGTGRHFLVELKVCSQWRRYESQVKKYINACHSINRKIAGAAIVNFNPKGMVEVVMFECNVRHSVA